MSALNGLARRLERLEQHVLVGAPAFCCCPFDHADVVGELTAGRVDPLCRRCGRPPRIMLRHDQDEA